ncbi:MAG: archaemetzincin family Zn-dependent metalloprotease [Thermoproteota archaeon]
MGRVSGRAEDRILIMPVGGVNPNELTFLPAELTKIFRLMVEIGKPIPRIPSEAYDRYRRQYNSTLILKYLKSIRPEGYMKYLGIVDVDMYAAGLNFVFGEADPTEGCCVVSINRLRPEFYGEPSNQDLLKERILKEAVHELGHTFGLKHCRDSRCVMHFSNSILDTDYKRALPCIECEAKLLGRLI